MYVMKGMRAKISEVVTSVLKIVLKTIKYRWG